MRENTERNLLAVSIKHTEYRWKFGMPCVLWGKEPKMMKNAPSVDILNTLIGLRFIR